MALLTPAQLREHIETDLGDDALNRVLDAIEVEIIRRYGPHSDEFTEHHTPGCGDSYIFTTRPIDTAEDVTIVETFPGPAGETIVTLSTDDYIVDDTSQIRRIQNGTNSREFWAAIADVTYTPVDDTTRRVMVQVDVARLDLAQLGGASLSMGDWQMSQGNYQIERERRLRSLQPSHLGSFA